MAESCALIPKVKRANGELVESKLFNNLLSYTNNRTQAKEYYAVGKNQDFLDEVEDKAKFDENGEITLNSLRTLANLDIEEDKIIKDLNTEIGAGNYSYDEAISRMQLFNGNHRMKDDYMATISNINGGKVKLEVVPNNDANVDKLIETISNRTLQDRLKYKLSQLGVEVGFLDEPNIHGRYSTENAEKTASGMYNLINIAHGEEGNEVLAEETGHFIVGALGNNPLVTRLLGLLTPQMQESILGEYKYREIYGRQNPDREVAGYLIGEVLKGEPDKSPIISKLINRIIGVAKRIFYKIKGDEISYIKSQAREIAEKIAENFMSNNFQGSLENALNKKETLYNADDSVPVENLKRMVKILHAQALRIKNIDTKLSERYFRLLDYIEKGKIFDSPNNLHADNLAIDGIVALANILPHELESIVNKLASINIGFDDINSENAKKLMEADTFISNTIELKKIIDNITVAHVESKSLLTTEPATLDELRILSGKIGEILNGSSRGSQGLIALRDLKMKEFYTKFLEHGLGRDYIEVAARIVFGREKKPGEPGKGKLSILAKEAEKIRLDKIVEYQERDEGAFHMWLTSMSNATSLTNQLVNKMFRRMKKAANDRVIEVQNQLDALRNELKELGGNTREFFEIDPNINKLTGNIINKYLWGVIEKEYEELYASERKKFNETVDKSNKSRNEIATLWLAYWNPIYKQWQQSHFTLAADGKTLVPVDAYINDVYVNTIEGTEKEKWLEKFKALKQGIDEECLGKNNLTLRAPQFKGLSMHKLRNRMSNSSFGKALGGTIWSNVTETFLEDAEDRDFGSQLTYNPQEMLSTDAEIIEEDKIKRIPLFGINKLDNMDDLSTDLFHSTLAYASMAYRYNISRQFGSILEVGKEVMKRTRYGKKIGSTGDKEEANSYKRLQRFLDKELYGFKTYKVTLGNVVINKIISFFSRLASRVYLGGNVAGGIVNVGTGSIEIFKEAVSGEHFNVQQWKRANKEYWKHFPSNILHMGELRKFDKISLLIDRFDSQNDSDERQFSYHTDRAKFLRLNPIGDNLFLPYKCGEHYMQNIAFIASAMGTVLVDPKTGETTNLYDALITEDVKDSNGNIIGKRLILDKEYVTDSSHVDTYNMISKISASLNNAGTFGVMWTPEEINFLNNNDIEPNAPKEVIFSKLREIRSKILWDTFKESDFMDKCREVNNRLHGIYNSQDKTLMHQKYYLNAFVSMRNYAFGMINRRFGSSVYSLALGHDTEGSVNTVAKVFASMFTDKGGWDLTMRAMFLPFSDKTKTKMLAAGFSANQYANIRRSGMDSLFVAALVILKLAMYAGKGDDDEEDNIPMGIAYYFASRLLREQSAFNSPWGFIAELPSLTNTEFAGMSILLDMFYITELAAKQAVGDESAYYQKNGATYDEHDSKLFVKLEKLCPYWRSILTLKNPYESAKSYEYGRRNISR